MEEKCTIAPNVSSLLQWRPTYNLNYDVLSVYVQVFYISSVPRWILCYITLCRRNIGELSVTPCTAVAAHVASAASISIRPAPLVAGLPLAWNTRGRCWGLAVDYRPSDPRQCSSLTPGLAWRRGKRVDKGQGRCSRVSFLLPVFILSLTYNRSLRPPLVLLFCSIKLIQAIQTLIVFICRRQQRQALSWVKTWPARPAAAWHGCAARCAFDDVQRRAVW